jgi:predicted aspartyl protease
MSSLVKLSVKTLFVLMAFVFIVLFKGTFTFEETKVKTALTVSIEALLNTLGYTKVPLIKKNEGFYITGTVGGQRVYFLIDTGSVEASIVSDGVVTLKLDPIQSEEKKANMTGEITDTKKVFLSHCTIGNIHVDEISAAVMDQPFTNDLPTIILGNDFFLKNNAIIDIRHHALYLNQSAVSSQDQHRLKQLLAEHHYQQIPLTTLSSRHCIVPVQINDGLPVNFLFDTGTSATTVSDVYVKSLNINPTTPYRTQVATDGSITYAEINLKKIMFNPLQVFFQKPIELSNSSALSANIACMATFLGVVGIIGLADMERLNTIISVPTQSVFFTLVQ